MPEVLRTLAAGAAAGAAGTTALNAAAYLDMAVRGRASSDTPERSVQRLADLAGLTVPGDEQARGNRLSGLGALTGTLTGVGIGVGAGAALAALARVLPGRRLSFPVAAVALTVAVMGASDGMMTVLGVTDPRTWEASSWAADLLPHLAYGAAAAGVLRLTGGCHAG